MTLSLIFGLAWNGIWAGPPLRDFFRWVGLAWPLVWLLPVVLVWLLARFEPYWLPRPRIRHAIAVFCVAGALSAGYWRAKADEWTTDKTPAIRAGPTNAFKRLGTKPGL